MMAQQHGSERSDIPGPAAIQPGRPGDAENVEDRGDQRPFTERTASGMRGAEDVGGQVFSFVRNTATGVVHTTGAVVGEGVHVVRDVATEAAQAVGTVGAAAVQAVGGVLAGVVGGLRDVAGAAVSRRGPMTGQERGGFSDWDSRERAERERAERESGGKTAQQREKGH